MVTWAWATPGRDTTAATAAVRPTPTRRAVRRAEVLVDMMRSRFVEGGRTAAYRSGVTPLEPRPATSRRDRTVRLRRRPAAVDHGGRPRAGTRSTNGRKTRSSSTAAGAAGWRPGPSPVSRTASGG